MSNFLSPCQVIGYWGREGGHKSVPGAKRLVGRKRFRGAVGIWELSSKGNKRKEAGGFGG